MISLVIGKCEHPPPEVHGRPEAAYHWQYVCFQLKMLEAYVTLAAQGMLSTYLLH